MHPLTEAALEADSSPGSLAALLGSGRPVPVDRRQFLKATGIAGGGLMLTWDAHDGDAQGIIVERRAEDGAAWSLLARLPASSRYYTDPGATSRTASYRVRAFNSGGTSAYSNIARVQDAR